MRAKIELYISQFVFGLGLVCDEVCSWMFLNESILSVFLTVIRACGEVNWEQFVNAGIEVRLGI